MRKIIIIGSSILFIISTYFGYIELNRYIKTSLPRHFVEDVLNNPNNVNEIFINNKIIDTREYLKSILPNKPSEYFSKSIYGFNDCKLHYDFYEDENGKFISEVIVYSKDGCRKITFIFFGDTEYKLALVGYKIVCPNVDLQFIR